MSKAIENLQSALQRAMAGCPKAGGFPYLAETLRQAGILTTSGICPPARASITPKMGR